VFDIYDTAETTSLDCGVIDQLIKDIHGSAFADNIIAKRLSKLQSCYALNLIRSLCLQSVSKTS
jgi:hypothetical protein